MPRYTKRVAGERQPLDAAQPRRHDPARIATRILLQRALDRAACTFEETVRPGFVCIVLVHAEAWNRMAQAGWAAIAVEILGEKGWTDRAKLVTSDFHDYHKSLSETVAHVLGSGLSCTIFALHSDTLPPELLVGADRIVRIEPPDRSVIAEVAAELYGSAPAACSLTDAEAATLTPVALRLAYRPDETADAFMGRLEDLLEAREAATPAEPAVPERRTVRSEPSLDRLHGMDEATTWGRSLIRDLSAYRAGELPWEDVDGGCVLSGPPGCGKTTFVRALAADCGVPLIAATYGEWQAAGHQGDLLKAMRKSFKKARDEAPSIMFIDELDSFGDRMRVDSGLQNGSYEFQVINALLAEVDGVQGHDGVVIVGACNHPHKLDPALVRSGRLDRHIHIPKPDTAALAAILREHLGADLASADLRRFARLAPGYTGADCERLVRLARRRARSEGRGIASADLEAVLLPEDGRTDAVLRIAAVHEAGHAVAALSLLPPGMLLSVSLRASGDMGGATLLRAEWASPTSAAALEDTIVFLLAGRAAEEILTGTVTAGCGGNDDSDLARATTLVLHTMTAYGLGKPGLVWRGKHEIRDTPEVLARDPALAREVGDRMSAAYSRALEFIGENRSAVARVAAALLACTVLDAAEVDALARCAGRTGSDLAGSRHVRAQTVLENPACPTF